MVFCEPTHFIVAGTSSSKEEVGAVEAREINRGQRTHSPTECAKESDVYPTGHGKPMGALGGDFAYLLSYDHTEIT